MMLEIESMVASKKLLDRHVDMKGKEDMGDMQTEEISLTTSCTAWIL